MASKKNLLVMSPTALRLLAEEWYLKGFRESGKNFNGQTRAARDPAVEALLRSEFRRAWAASKGK